MTYHYYEIIIKRKSVKVIFNIIALFYFQFNFSQTETYADNEPIETYNSTPTSSEKAAPKTNHTAKENKLLNFKPSIDDSTELNGFSFHEKYYTVNFPIDGVWDTYANTKPTECWTGPLTRYKKSSFNSLFHNFKEEDHPTFGEGSVYLVRLKLAPLIKITVIFKLTKINQSDKIIVMTYGMNNTSHGKQTIQFIADGDKTLIKHTAYFKSKSKFRDKYLYPKFHVKYIDEFHENIKKKLICNSTNNDVANQEQVDH